MHAAYIIFKATSLILLLYAPSSFSTQECHKIKRTSERSHAYNAYQVKE